MNDPDEFFFKKPFNILCISNELTVSFIKEMVLVYKEYKPLSNMLQLVPH